MICRMLVPLLLMVLVPRLSCRQCGARRDQQPGFGVSTKTPYRLLVEGRGLPAKVSEGNCSAVHVWGLYRHGTRYPSKEAIHRMGPELDSLRQRMVQGEGSLCPEELEAVRRWKVELEETQEKLLHPEGEKELEGIGERLHSRFPDLLDPYRSQDFIFRATNTQRAMESGRFFARGLFGSPVAWQDPLTPHDPLIRSYKLCRRWRRDVKKNPEAQAEKEKFERSAVMDEVRGNMSSLLGLEPLLTMAELDLLYVTCNFDMAWRSSGVGPWCSLFSKEHLEALEYREDLEYYWVDGPGYAVTGAQSCGLLQDLIHSFSQAEGGRRGEFYFSHSGALLKFLAFLGVYNDTEPLRSDNYPAMRSRLWRTSNIGPFAGNIVFVLFDCEPEFEGREVTDGEERMKVVLYVNEEAADIPGCGEPGEPCTLAGLRRVAGRPCSFQDICDDSEEGDSDGGEEVPDDKY